MYALYGRPIDQKCGLQAIYPFPFYLEVVVPPYPPTRSFHITVGDIHTAEEPDPAVDDHDLAVVAVIDPVGQHRKAYVQQSMDFRTRVAHLLEKSFLDSVAAHVVVEHTDFDALLCLADQRLLETGARFIVTKI